MQADLRCYYHPDREAAGQCDRCGDYLCAPCTRELDGQQLCARCLRTLTHPRLHVAGSWASVVNLVGGLAFFPVSFLFGFLFANRAGTDVALASALLVLFAVALALGIRARIAADRDARKLADAVLLLACGGVWNALTLLALAAFWASLPESDLLDALRQSGPIILVDGLRQSGPIILVGVVLTAGVLVAALVRWGQAVYAGVRPKRTLILTFITIAFGALNVWFYLQLAIVG